MFFIMFSNVKIIYKSFMDHFSWNILDFVARFSDFSVSTQHLVEKTTQRFLECVQTQTGS